MLLDDTPINDPFTWNESLHSNYLWSNVNFGEAITSVMTPLTWSVLQFTLKDWQYMRGMPTIGNIGGFPYLNISIFISLFKALGRDRQDLTDELEATLYIKLPNDTERWAFHVSPLQLLFSLWNSGRVQIRQKLGVLKTPGYLKDNREWFQTIVPKIHSTGNQQALVELFRREIAPHIMQGVWCVLGIATHSANYTIRLRRELASLVGQEDANILIANTSEANSALLSLGPTLGLSKVASGEITKEQYLEEYGHRGPEEFELSVPRPEEDPHWLDTQVEMYSHSPVDVDALLHKQRQVFEGAWQRLQASFPQEAKSIRRRIAESTRRIRLREEARSAYVRDRWSLRLFSLQASELCGLGEDIFFLTLGEMLDLLTGKRAALRYIPARKGCYQRYQARLPYPSLIQGPFDPLGVTCEPLAEQATGIIIGSAGSAGVVEGTVRVLKNPVEGRDLQRGEILVAYQTDIAWSLLFPLAAAVVTDVGAPLSHAAIVARELGIPAVVGCGNATQRLETGDRVRVDGGRGTVEILKLPRIGKDRNP